MQSWLVYGLLASLCFGINVIIFKIATTRGNGLNPYLAAFAYGTGGFLLFSIFYLFNMTEFNSNWKGIWLGVLSGAMWALGMVLVALAIAKKADIARLAPIYNTNTLVAVVLGIILLKEIPDATNIIKVVAGALMIVIGAVLVSI